MDHLLTKAQIQEMLDRAEKTPVGPWHACTAWRDDPEYTVCPCLSVFDANTACLCSMTMDEMGDPELTFKDVPKEWRERMAVCMDFIAAARTDVPALAKTCLQLFSMVEQNISPDKMVLVEQINLLTTALKDSAGCIAYAMGKAFEKGDRRWVDRCSSQMEENSSVLVEVEGA